MFEVIYQIQVNNPYVLIPFPYWNEDVDAFYSDGFTITSLIIEIFHFQYIVD
jgi:hypothetical protein